MSPCPNDFRLLMFGRRHSTLCAFPGCSSRVRLQAGLTNDLIPLVSRAVAALPTVPPPFSFSSRSGAIQSLLAVPSVDQGRSDQFLSSLTRLHSQRRFLRLLSPLLADATTLHASEMHAFSDQIFSPCLVTCFESSSLLHDAFRTLVTLSAVLLLL
jgi:hypothetical protein